jgi:class 3 adenylate cyclase
MAAPDPSASSGRRHIAVRVSVNCAVGLASAHLLAACGVAVAIIALSRAGPDNAESLFTQTNLLVASALIVISATGSALFGVLDVVPTLRLFVDGAVPTRAQQHAILRIAHRQTATHFATWAVSGAVFALVNLNSGGVAACIIGTALLFGGVTTACMGYLVTQRTLRPVIAAAMSTAPPDTATPGVLPRLVVTWMLFGALPIGGIAVIAVARFTGWFTHPPSDIGTPILIVAALSVLLGVRATVLVARSISDPVREVVDAMADLERGVSAYVAVYDGSEIGRLQSGFNRMVAGLAERQRLSDLFGRHVGADVARRAVEQGTALTGDVLEVGVLFVDLANSTLLTATRPPEEVAELLNDFFRLVVAAVDEHQGLLNKFEGDAALAVFGAPLRIDRPASAALATGRALTHRLRALPVVGFGVGISAGCVFAGNIGAENRYEYTVIGDPVNEAARLADHAKHRTARTLASGSALTLADPGEGQWWVLKGSTVLRGRSTATVLFEPLAPGPTTPPT